MSRGRSKVDHGGAPSEPGRRRSEKTRWRPAYSADFALSDSHDDLSLAHKSPNFRVNFACLFESCEVERDDRSGLCGHTAGTRQRGVSLARIKRQPAINPDNLAVDELAA